MGSFKLFFLGLPFLLRSIGFRFFASVYTEEEILSSKLVPSKEYRFRYFLTKKKFKKTPPTILLTHGMSGFGIDDKRMTDLAINLSACGYNVVLPEFAEIKALIITPDSVQNIKDVFLIILENKNLNTEDMGFFSVSFSAGFGLVSFSDPLIADKVKSILAIGGFAELLDTCRYAISNYLRDDYSTNILFYNYLHLIINDAAALEEIFYQAALDNGYAKPETDKIAPVLYKSLSKQHREFFDRVKVDAEFRKELVGKINFAYSAVAKTISPLYFVQNIKAPVCLIHGADDNVISENESLKLADKMKEYGLNFRLEITGLLAHGDKVPFWKQIGGLPRLAAAFGYFFENLNEKE